jgi:hypothetical protein
MNVKRIVIVFGALAFATGDWARGDFGDGLTAYWRFDESSGTIANDSVANYDATLRPNAAFVNDPIRGQVLSTGAGTSLYDNDGGIPFLSTSAGSLMAWINLPDGEGFHFIFESVDYSVASEPRLYVYVVNHAFKIGIGTQSAYSTSVSNVSENTWHQVAMTWKEIGAGSGSGDVTAFFDGQSVFGTTYTGLSSLGHYLATGSTFFPSPGGGVVGNSLNGLVDEAAVWNRELAQQEVLDLYNQGFVLPKPPTAGDFNSDGQVDGADLTDPVQGWKARFGMDLGGADFLEWQRNLGATSSLAAAASVPEPATAGLLILSFAVAVDRRRKAAAWGVH